MKLRRNNYLEQLQQRREEATTIIGVTSQRAAGPDRGDVEQTLAYLAGLAAEEQAVRAGAA